MITRLESERAGWGHRDADEALLVTTAERRPRPSGALRVLLVGGAAPEQFLLRFVLGDLRRVRVVDSAPDAAGGLAAIGRGAPDLVFADQSVDLDCLRRRLDDARPRGGQRPLLVLLTDRIEPDAAAPGAPDAQMLKPVSHDRCRALVERLFPG